MKKRILILLKLLKLLKNQWLNQIKKKLILKKAIIKGYFPTKDEIKNFLKISTNNSIYGWQLFRLNDINIIIIIIIIINKPNKEYKGETN